MGVYEDSSMAEPPESAKKWQNGNQNPYFPDKSSAIDKQFLASPIKSTVDKFQLLPEFLKVRGLVKQHLDSYNYFVNTEIKKIVRANSRIVSNEDKSIYLRFKDVRIGEPSITKDGMSEKLDPQTCRLSDITYAAPIKVDVEYVSGSHAQKTLECKDNVIIGRMPIMLRSCCCVLNGKDEAELAKLGECPLDPGGYFVIKGTEKVILIQEQLSKNRIILDTDKKGNINASVTSSSETIKSKTVIQMEKEKLYLMLNQFTTKKIPIMVVMKAMGMESDQEVVQMVGRDPRYGALLMPSIEECAKEGIYTKEQALEYLGSKVKRSMYGEKDKEKEDGRAMLMTILRDVFIANVRVHQNNFRPKCIYVAVMLRRIMDAMLNKDAMDDKDYVGNKRLELSGQLISLLFEDLFKTFIVEVRKTVDTILQKHNRSSRFEFIPCLMKDIITHGLERSLSTGNWDLKRFKMHRKGMTQVLARLSFIGSLGHMTRILPQFEKSRKVSGPRALQPSQMDSWLGNRKRILVLNREDMISTADRNAWATYFASQGTKVVFSNGQLGMGTMRLSRLAKSLAEGVNIKRRAKGLLPHSVRAGIVGYPNVGKSSLINRLLKRRMCPAAPRPGVTRVLKWVRFGKDLELLDSPGMIPMRISDQTAAIKLAICDDIGERSYNVADVAAILVQMLARLPSVGIEVLQKRYKIDVDGQCGKVFVQKLALHLFNGDTHQAAFRILSDFRKGKFGWIALEQPPR